MVWFGRANIVYCTRTGRVTVRDFAVVFGALRTNRQPCAHTTPYYLCADIIGSRIIPTGRCTLPASFAPGAYTTGCTPGGKLANGRSCTVVCGLGFTQKRANLARTYTCRNGHLVASALSTGLCRATPTPSMRVCTCVGVCARVCYAVTGDGAWPSKAQSAQAWEYVRFKWKHACCCSLLFAQCGNFPRVRMYSHQFPTPAARTCMYKGTQLTAGYRYAFTNTVATPTCPVGANVMASCSGSCCGAKCTANNPVMKLSMCGRLSYNLLAAFPLRPHPRLRIWALREYTHATSAGS